MDAARIGIPAGRRESRRRGLRGSATSGGHDGAEGADAGASRGAARKLSTNAHTTASVLNAPATYEAGSISPQNSIITNSPKNVNGTAVSQIDTRSSFSRATPIAASTGMTIDARHTSTMRMSRLRYVAKNESPVDEKSANRHISTTNAHTAIVIRRAIRTRTRTVTSMSGR